MGDNEKKENPVQEEEGDRESLAPNAATADEVEPVETEVRDALLALTAEVKMISERMGSLQTSQQRVWQCMQENADGQDQLMGRMREVEQRQGNLAQQQRKFQDAQDGRLDEIMRRLSAVEVVQKKRVNEAAGDVVKDGPGGRFGPLPGMSAVSAMPHVSTPVVDDFDADTSDAGVDPQRNVTMRQRKLSHSQRRARDRNLLQEREQEVALEMDLAETHRKMGVGDSMPTGGARKGAGSGAKAEHHPAMAMWNKRDQARLSESSVKQGGDEPQNIQVIRGGNDLMTAPALTLAVCQQASRRVRMRMMVRWSGNAQIRSSQRCKPLMVSQANGGPSSFSFERWLKLVSGAIGRNETRCWRVSEAKPSLTSKASQSHAEAITKHFGTC